MSPPDWYCDQVIPGRSNVEILLETPEVLAIRPDRPGFSAEHIIVVPKVHVPSLRDSSADHEATDVGPRRRELAAPAAAFS
jgi:diadenosine tetraphosphate (Ap4A) HIT family hydrolase